MIPSVTQPFCDTCNRLRLTADGHLRACLFSLEETDLRGPLRDGRGRCELAPCTGVRGCEMVRPPDRQDRFRETGALDVDDRRLKPASWPQSTLGSATVP